MKKARKKTPPKPQAPQAEPTEISNHLRFFTERKDAITETIRQLVEVESPSDNKQAVDRLGALLAGRFERLGGHSKFHRTQDFGDHLQVDFATERSGGEADRHLAMQIVVIALEHCVRLEMDDHIEVA